MKNSNLDAGFVMDMASLDRLRAGVKSGKEGEEAGLRAAAEQFEAIFTQMLFKSMRQANSVFESGLTRNQNSKFFEQMHDDQMASELSSSNSLGLADMIVEQLGAHMSSDKANASAAAEPTHNLLPPPSTGIAFSREGNEVALDLQQPRQPLNAAHSIAPSMAALQKAFSLKADNTMSARQEGIAEPEQAAKPLKSLKPESFESPQAFVKAMKPFAVQASKALGVEPSVLIAQAALETGWGKKVIHNAADHSHNLFNIKADKRWGGEKIATQTLEFHQGIPVKETAAFRSYHSYGDSFNDYVQFLKENPRYSKALEQTDKPDQFVREIHQAGYATDPQYSDKVLQVLDKVNTLMAE